MVFKMSDTLVLSSSADAMAELPQQAFALTLSDDMIEDMIACVQKGQEIQLSLGDSPTFLFANEEHKIEPTNFLPYDLYHSDETDPTHLQKLPTEAMPLLGNKPRVMERRAVPLPKRNPVNIRPPRAKTTAKAPTSDLAADIATLQQGLAQAAAETQTTRLAEGPALKKRGGTYDLIAKPLPSASSSGLKSNTASPALSSAFGSPLSQAEQEEGRRQASDTAKRQRFPLIHELAVRDQSLDELMEKWNGVETDLPVQLKKIALFQDDTQLWSLSKTYWKDLDPFSYPYKTDEDRQKAIDNAIRQFDRARVGSSDPLWQKLLPKEDRGKGICLSRLQASIAHKTAAVASTATSTSSSTTHPPKINIQKPDASSPSATSEKSDSAASTTKTAKGGEPMARSNSGNKPKKLTASEAQARRLMSKPGAAKTAVSKATKTTASAKPSPKIGLTASPRISPTKPTTKAPTAKGGRVLSKEFISDSDSDGSGDEAPATSAVSKAKAGQQERPVEKAKPAEKPKPANRARESPAPAPKTAVKPKPAPVRRASPAVEKAAITGISARTKQPVKRSRDEEDDSSSEGAPLMKRQKSREQMASKAPAVQSKDQEYRKSSDNGPSSSQMSRTSSSATSASSTKAPPRQMARPKATKAPAGNTVTKTTSPVKSSPLSSPPNNASDTDERRRPAVAPKKRKLETASYSFEERRRDGHDSSDSSGTKRRKLSPDTLEKANEFKAYYATYEALHKEIMSLEYPPADKLDQLTKMHKRLACLKEEIYSEVE